MKKKIYLIISFDHELSLGGASSYSKNLFDPSNRILELANKINVPIAYFTDILCALKFKDWDNTHFYEPYKKQIQQTLLAGHDIQLHLHPHWIDSTWEDGKFNPSKNYRLGDFKNGQYPNNIPGIVKQGTDLLKEICSEVDSNYKCIAYRAGGYNFSPYTDDILKALYDNGIRIDSSVAKGFYFASKISEVNYRQMPNAANWTIPLTGPMSAKSSNGLYEIPIASSPRNTLNNIPVLIKRVLHRNRIFDSGGWGIHDGNTSKLSKLKRLFPKSAWMVNFDTFAFTNKDLHKVLNYHLKKHKNEDTIIASIISHPKSMGSYSLKLMNEFVESVRDKYEDEVEFTTYRKIHESLLNKAQNGEIFEKNHSKIISYKDI